MKTKRFLGDNEILNEYPRWVEAAEGVEIVSVVAVSEPYAYLVVSYVPADEVARRNRERKLSHQADDRMGKLILDLQDKFREAAIPLVWVILTLLIHLQFKGLGLGWCFVAGLLGTELLPICLQVVGNLRKLAREHVFIVVFLMLCVLYAHYSVFFPAEPQLGVQKLIAVENINHDTRVQVVYKDYNGEYYTESVHQANTFCGISPRWWLPRYGGFLPYGPFAGQEKEYHRYLEAR